MFKGGKLMQGMGFEPTDSFETGCLITNLSVWGGDLKSCAVGQAWLPLQDIAENGDADAGTRTRAEGLEGLNHNR